jgi:DNA-binding XRE family transcriptional regulator
MTSVDLQLLKNGTALVNGKIREFFTTGEFRSVSSCCIEDLTANDLIKIGENIKRFRLKEKITQKELAEKIGVTHFWVCKLEKGKQNNTTINLLIAISKELKIELYELIK